MIWVLSGGLCAFPDCRLRLIDGATLESAGTSIGKIAHIVARSPSGPRGEGQPPGGDVNGVQNLILLCPTHHEVVDGQPDVYTAERLTGIKEDHERWVREQLAPQEAGDDPGPLRSDTLHSALLAAELPAVVFSAACLFEDSDVRTRLRAPADRGIALPYFVEAGQLYTFTPLSSEDHPFADVVRDPRSVAHHRATDWWNDEVQYRRYIRLLNRSLNKVTGRRGLNLDKEHHRYYFEPEVTEDGRAQPRRVSYRSLNRENVERNVVWQPLRKRTGAPRPYWVHLAVGLRFHRVAATQWVLSVRPEFRLTRDGFEPLPSDVIGARTTRFKSHLYNYELLGELQFWKDYLTDGQPRAILDFGGQSLILGGEFLRADVEWPGVPGDELPFENIAPPEDLFTAAAFDRAQMDARHIDAELEEWERQDLRHLVDRAEPSSDHGNGGET